MAVGPDRALLGDVSCTNHLEPFDERSSATLPVRQKRTRAERVRGTVAVLAFPFAGTNYYHWMLDSVARLDLLDRAGV
ncbi:MAG: hypothetical protein AAF596_01025, partial [Planctomycetota bacterium]